MKIELKRIDNVDGKHRFEIYVDGVVSKSVKMEEFRDPFAVAKGLYDEMVERARTGYPKTEVLETFEI